MRDAPRFWCPCDVVTSEAGRCPRCKHARIDLSTPEGRRALELVARRARDGRKAAVVAVSAGLGAAAVAALGRYGWAEALGVLAALAAFVAAMLGVRVPRGDQMRS